MSEVKVKKFYNLTVRPMTDEERDRFGAHHALAQKIMRKQSHDVRQDALVKAMLAWVRHRANTPQVKDSSFVGASVAWSMKSAAKDNKDSAVYRTFERFPDWDITQSPEDDLDLKLDTQEKLQWLRETVDHLPDREQEVIRFKLLGMSNEQIGPKIGLSKQRVQQIVATAVKLLKGMANVS